jgi:RNA polymerase sigma-70 factor (ECF subfamily)
MTDVDEAIAESFRREWAWLVAALIRWCGDWDLAEDSAQEAFGVAARTWSRDGIPDRPAAWLLSVARRRAIDRLRRDQRGETKLRQLAVTEAVEGPGPDAGVADAGAADAGIGDDRLRLIYTCCHPALAMDSQVVLALRTLAGLSTAEIAHAFGVPEPTMAKRLVRAKHKIRDAAIPFRTPPAHLLPERTAAVLAVVYLLFNEGYLATSGPELHRPDLAAEAIRLAALVVQLMPDDPEARGLLALLLFHQARASTRVSADGVLIPLEEQDRDRWDRGLIARGLEEMVRAARREQFGPYLLQAMIAACHVRAAAAEETDWARIVELYDALLVHLPSPVVALNRAVAVAMASGAQVGLDLVDGLARDGGLAGSHLLPAVRADLLRRLGRIESAASAYLEAIALTANDAERAYLSRRLGEVSGGAPQ